MLQSGGLLNQVIRSHFYVTVIARRFQSLVQRVWAGRLVARFIRESDPIGSGKRSWSDKIMPCRIGIVSPYCRCRICAFSRL